MTKNTKEPTCSLSKSEQYHTITLQKEDTFTILHCRPEELLDCHEILHDFLFHNDELGFCAEDIFSCNVAEKPVRCAHAYAQGINCGKRAAYQITDRFSNAKVVMLRIYASRNMSLEAIDDASTVLTEAIDPTASILWSMKISNEPFAHVRIAALIFE